MRKSLWQLDREAICLILASIIAISVLTLRRAVFMEPQEGIADPQPSRGSRDHATGPWCPPSQPWCPKCQEAVCKRLLFTGLLTLKSSSNWGNFPCKWNICIFSPPNKMASLWHWEIIREKIPKGINDSKHSAQNSSGKHLEILLALWNSSAGADQSVSSCLLRYGFCSLSFSKCSLETVIQKFNLCFVHGSFPSLSILSKVWCRQDLPSHSWWLQ